MASGKHLDWIQTGQSSGRTLTREVVRGMLGMLKRGL